PKWRLPSCRCSRNEGNWRREIRKGIRLVYLVQRPCRRLTLKNADFPASPQRAVSGNPTHAACAVAGGYVRYSAMARVSLPFLNNVLAAVRTPLMMPTTGGEHVERTAKRHAP